MITILYFARLKEIAGKQQEKLALQSITVQELLTWAGSAYEGFPAESGSVLVAINEEYAQPGDEILAGDTVAFIPPVSGG
jgi:sulfur-carrier protein